MGRDRSNRSRLGNRLPTLLDLGQQDPQRNPSKGDPMKKAVLFLALCLALSGIGLFAGWSPAWEKRPPIPMAGLYTPGVGRCVALYEGDTLVGITSVPYEDMRKADRNRDSYAISTYNALGLIAQSARRPDLASAAVELRMVNGPSASVESQTTECWCTNTVWSGTPGRGGKITGCEGPCGSCTRCSVVVRQIE
jgi:hypothetical protein